MVWGAAKQGRPFLLGVEATYSVLFEENIFVGILKRLEKPGGEIGDP
jgi:hypothetical protein